MRQDRPGVQRSNDLRSYEIRTTQSHGESGGFSQRGVYRSCRNDGWHPRSFDLFKNNVLAAKCGFLAFVIRTFIGLRTYHRHKILKTRTIGRLGPFLAFAAALATVSIHQLDIIP
jgi:hypothetical protein